MWEKWIWKGRQEGLSHKHRELEINIFAKKTYSCCSTRTTRLQMLNYITVATLYNWHMVTLGSESYSRGALGSQTWPWHHLILSMLDILLSSARHLWALGELLDLWIERWFASDGVFIWVLPKTAVAWKITAIILSSELGFRRASSMVLGRQSWSVCQSLLCLQTWNILTTSGWIAVKFRCIHSSRTTLPSLFL